MSGAFRWPLFRRPSAKAFAIGEEGNTIMSRSIWKYGATVVVLAALTSAAWAIPFVSFETEADFSQMSPIPDWMFSDIEANNPTWTPPSGTYTEPFLDPLGPGAPGLPYVLDNGEEIPDDAGLIMGWGDDTGESFTGGWEYTYDLDPDIRTQTLSASVIAPQFAASGTQMNSISLGFLDVNGAMRLWTWLCGPTAGVGFPNTIAWNTQWDVTIGPIADFIPPFPPGPASAIESIVPVNTVLPIFFTNPAFDASQVITIIGLENGLTAAMSPLPPGGLPQMPMWNWWGSVMVTPEPATMSLLALGGLAVLRRRKK